MYGTLSDTNHHDHHDHRLQKALAVNKSPLETGFSGNSQFQPMTVTEECSQWNGQASLKSWAKLTEESYQLQLALALRLSSQSACADDPNFLDLESSSSSNSAEAVSHRFWVWEICSTYCQTIQFGNMGLIQI